jgi:HEXXH motif-containing protein
MIELAVSNSSLKEKKFKGFACPQEGLDERFLQSLAVAHARKSVRNFLGRFNQTLDQYSNGLTSLLQDWLLKESSFEAVWDLSLGNILNGFPNDVKNRERVMRRAAELALHLMDFGLEGRWQARLIEPVRLRFGKYWLPLAERLEVEAGAGQIILKVTLGTTTQQYEFRRGSEGWQTGENRLECFRYVKTGAGQIKLLPAGVFQPDELEVYTMASPTTTATMKHNLEQALQLIQQYSPVYLSWVERVTRALIPVGVNANQFFSGSLFARPGVIHMSMEVQPVIIAELLVHEATHQYMHLLRRLGPLDDGSDPTLYYSPVKQTGRPIGAIALAYHAFANIVLFYRLCQVNNLADDGYCRRNEMILADQVYVLEQALHTSQALTAQGRALWEPLAWRLREA